MSLRGVAESWAQWVGSSNSTSSDHHLALPRLTRLALRKQPASSISHAGTSGPRSTAGVQCVSGPPLGGIWSGEGGRGGAVTLACRSLGFLAPPTKANANYPFRTIQPSPAARLAEWNANHPSRGPGHEPPQRRQTGGTCARKSNMNKWNRGLSMTDKGNIRFFTFPDLNSNVVTNGNTYTPDILLAMGVILMMMAMEKMMHNASHNVIGIS
ncbi:hypothetical protein E2C01_010612 [Portunus trituberculatus]|uniref:Uncharacterized protein n=1 Tax=Portunus trituberculatus TaxID=210409 RepID=A0A5B7D955_PORTR|nr:hypothetical protein [Portunus trituberculatus]